VAFSATVHGGKDIFAKSAKGGRATREMERVVNSVGEEMRTSWISGWEGRAQWGTRGAIETGAVSAVSAVSAESAESASR
jgi:hypothetical protein